VARVAPRRASEVRKAARLNLAGGGSAIFVTWQAVSGAHCYGVVAQRSPSFHVGAALDACAEFPRLCARLCLSPFSVGTLRRPHFVLAGTADEEGTELALNLVGGARLRVPLALRIVATRPESFRRIVLVDLGSRDWYRGRLLHHRHVLAVVRNER
jgi:hypothetical protein